MKINVFSKSLANMHLADQIANNVARGKTPWVQGRTPAND